MKISACLVSWKRKFHLPEICENLLQFAEIGEVIVWQNESDGTLPGIPCDVRVIHSDENEGVSGRFLAASEAKYDTVYFQDDDLQVHNIPELAQLSEESDTELIIANLAQDKSSRHWSKWRQQKPPWIELGFGSVAPKKFIDILSEWPYDGELLRRKADKIFSVMNPWFAVRAGENKITRLYHNGRESGRDPNSLWLRDDHLNLSAKAVALTQQWKLDKEK